MTQHNLSRARSELSDFLLQHRAKLTPADVGLPTTGRRRTPGLRREEVAALAGVGLTWYTWFEQGRDINVSESFLLSLAKALKLDDAECCHLFMLAHRRPPPTEGCQWLEVPPLIQTMMDDLEIRPAYVMNLRWDVIAWNQIADELFGFSHLDQHERNILRMVFANPALRKRLPAWQEDAQQILALFRCDLATAPQDPAMLTLIEDLKVLSADFRRWWKKPEPVSYRRGIASILDFEDKRLDFIHETLIVDEHRHLKMIAYFAQKAPQMTTPEI
ncbi:helix-turn-helix transcriptional regulator [Pseudomonas jilinensis]|uniref:Transcriptional regulator n=1 Tax=Pseudomonas jilinensis TaxID=2078689 RepID=A0A396S216_9PSED|nr:helix-turn-helix transcriptional regulator [Pseudomonas jilinensis]RHW23109.1 transcriptional regulator [Pseudomonas jilinensis]